MCLVSGTEIGVTLSSAIPALEVPLTDHSTPFLIIWPGGFEEP